MNGDWPTRDHIPEVSLEHQGAVYDDVDMSPYSLQGAEVISINEVSEAPVNQVRRAVRKQTCKLCSSPDCA